MIARVRFSRAHFKSSSAVVFSTQPCQIFISYLCNHIVNNNLTGGSIGFVDSQCILSRSARGGAGQRATAGGGGAGHEGKRRKPGRRAHHHQCRAPRRGIIHGLVEECLEGRRFCKDFLVSAKSDQTGLFRLKEHLPCLTLPYLHTPSRLHFVVFIASSLCECPLPASSSLLLFVRCNGSVLKSTEFKNSASARP